MATPQELMDDAACFACLPAGELPGVELQLLCNIIGGIAPPAPAPPPAAPMNLVIDPTSTNGGNFLHWDPQVPNPMHNNIYVSKNGGAYSLVAQISGAVNSYIDFNVMNNGDLWEYKVTADNGGTQSAPTNIGGVLNNVILNNTGLVTYSFPTVQQVNGNLSLTSQNSLTSVSLPLLVSVELTLEIMTCPVLTTISLPALIETLNGSLNIFNVGALTTLTMTQFGSCGGDFIVNAPALTSLSCDTQLTVVAGSLDVQASGWTALHFTSLQNLPIDFLALNCNALVTLTFGGGFTSVGGDFRLDSATLLATLTAPALTTIGRSFVLTNNNALVTLSLPLQTCVNIFNVDTCSALTTITLASLANNPGAITCQHCVNLATVTLTALDTVGVDFAFAHTPALATLSAPALTSIGGNFDLDTCGLTTLNLANLGAIGANLGGDFRIGGSSLTSITLNSLSQIVGAITTSIGQPLVSFTALALAGLNVPNVDFTNFASLTTVNWPSMIWADAGETLDWSGCALTQASVDQILHTLVTSGVTTVTGFFQGGTSATPSATGLADKATLNGSGNAITTN